MCTSHSLRPTPQMGCEVVAVMRGLCGEKGMKIERELKITRAERDRARARQHALGAALARLGRARDRIRSFRWTGWTPQRPACPHSTRRRLRRARRIMRAARGVSSAAWHSAAQRWQRLASMQLRTPRTLTLTTQRRATGGTWHLEERMAIVCCRRLAERRPQPPRAALADSIRAQDWSGDGAIEAARRRRRIQWRGSVCAGSLVARYTHAGGGTGPWRR